MKILNIAAYKFVTLAAEELERFKAALQKSCAALALKGTILLSQEGINLCVAGAEAAIAEFKQRLAEIAAFADLIYKESESQAQPFAKMLIKIKPEIIAFRAENIAPEKFTAPRIAPEQLKEWYAQEREMVVLDTRNDYEIRLGKFNHAIDLNLQHFRDFPQAAAELPKELKDKTIVTYCTGGIRCEKAAAWLLQAGCREVYQLDGGILNYFEKCGGDYYEGECFVFDDRIAVDAQLNEQNIPLCKACQRPMTPQERRQVQVKCSSCLN